MVTGGGTGGHLFPAVAAAQELKKRMPAARIMFVGTKRKLDREHLGNSEFELRTVHSFGLKGKTLPALMKALAVLPITVIEAVYHILRFRPDVVCGVGGYVTGPVVTAAWLLGKPTMIHEQNAVPGMANRKLGRLVNTVCMSLPESENCFPRGKTVLTGNPVRQDILETSALQQKRKKTLLVLGGSQGAHVLNELIVSVMTDGSGLSDVRLIHQTGAADEAWVSEMYQKCGLDATVNAFIYGMAEAYRQADLVVSRAGATTLAELAVMGLPVILIPLPNAADNHQEKNAVHYVAGGGAIMLRQQETSPGILGDQIRELLESPDRLELMSGAMARMGVRDAAERIVDLCLHYQRD